MDDRERKLRIENLEKAKAYFEKAMEWNDPRVIEVIADAMAEYYPELRHMRYGCCRD